MPLLSYFFSKEPRARYNHELKRWERHYTGVHFFWVHHSDIFCCALLLLASTRFPWQVTPIFAMCVLVYLRWLWGQAWEKDAELSAKQDTTVSRARSLHRVVRALHDGHCPRCGSIYPSHVMTDTAILSDLDGDMCPRCSFHVSEDEANEALQEFGAIMQENLKVFEEWRAARRT